MQWLFVIVASLKGIETTGKRLFTVTLGFYDSKPCSLISFINKLNYNILPDKYYLKLLKRTISDMLEDETRLAIIPWEGISGIPGFLRSLEYTTPLILCLPLLCLTGSLILHNVPFVRIIHNAGSTCLNYVISSECVMSEKVVWSESAIHSHTDPEIRLQ